MMAHIIRLIRNMTLLLAFVATSFANHAKIGEYLQEKLDLTNQLAPFQNCAVHLMFNLIKVKDFPQLDNTYELVPLAFPVVNSFYWYQKSPNGKVFCNRHPVELIKQSSAFLFRPHLQSKVTCTIHVYIDPAHCPMWEFQNPVLPGVNHINMTLPNTFLDIAADFREAIHIGICKYYWFFAHVTLDNG